MCCCMSPVGVVLQLLDGSYYILDCLVHIAALLSLQSFSYPTYLTELDIERDHLITGLLLNGFNSGSLAAYWDSL